MLKKFIILIFGLFLSMPYSSLAQTAASATFNTENNYGVKQITVNGKNLLTGCGFGFIGSLTGVDNSGNITSCRSNNGGVMRPFNGSQEPSLPATLTFTKGSSSNTIYFSGSIGPSAYNFSTVSMPMDSVDSFTYWRYSGSSSLYRYDQNSSCYYSPGSSIPLCPSSAPGYPAWGEILGVDYTIRVTLSSSSIPMKVFFVEAPGLGSGVRNVEFSFGGVKIGQKSTVSGKIEVFNTNLSILPKYVFQTENSGYHEMGRPDGDGWSVKVGDEPNKYMNYGPYTTSLPSGLRKAVFRLMVDNNTANDAHLLTLDAYDSTTGYVLSQLKITRKKFVAANRYQDFSLPFVAELGHKIELRTYWKGGAYIKQDSVTVR